MRFTQNHAFVAAAVSAVVAAAAGLLSGATPYGVPDHFPENHSLEGILDAWRKQFLACGSISTPRELAGFTAGTRSLMDATYHTVMSRPESPAAAHLIERIANYQTETYLCIHEKKNPAGAVP